MNKLIIKAPEGVKYLSEIFNSDSDYGDTLPKNCIFNKVTTGCGGTYVALTSLERTIIAVPTKALVRDKVEQEKYKPFNILGVSSDYPLRSVPKDCTKIICTYQMLPKLASKINIKNWNLVVDEMHLITRMISFSKPSLSWLLENFKNFASYCFMSATIPKEEHLLEPLKRLDRVSIDWPNLKEVSFECYHSNNIYETLLQVAGEHLEGKREGNAYFFYNSVDGICKLITTIKKVPRFKGRYSVIASKSSYTTNKLRKVGCSLSTPENFNKINFVTSASFEGVDFYDPDGVTYIVSDSNYDYTKYSIVTTIPQIVGRLRESKYNDRVTVFFDNHELKDSRTEKEFNEYIEMRLRKARGFIKSYTRDLADPETQDAAKNTLDTAIKDIYIEPVGMDIPLEEASCATAPLGTELRLFEEAKILDLEVYDLFKSSVYINDNSPNENHFAHKLSEVLGTAPVLSSEFNQIFKSRTLSLEKLCSLYEEDPSLCQDADGEWFEIIDLLGVEAVKSCSYNKTNTKALYNHRQNSINSSITFRIKRNFKVGEIYSKTYIKDYLKTQCGLDKAKATTIQEYFEVRTAKTSRGEHAFKIVREI